MPSMARKDSGYSFVSQGPVILNLRQSIRRGLHETRIAFCIRTASIRQLDNLNYSNYETHEVLDIKRYAQFIYLNDRLRNQHPRTALQLRQ